MTLTGGGSLSTYAHSTSATPFIQNNGDIVELSWTHTEGPFAITPYVQWTRASPITAAGVHYAGADSYGGAVLAKYSFTPTFSLAGRVEYISSSSTSCQPLPEACVQTSLLYGLGSDVAGSLTLTPTYQKGIFFVRAEGSFVSVFKSPSGAAFGETGNVGTQWRGPVETGLLF